MHAVAHSRDVSSAGESTVVEMPGISRRARVDGKFFAVGSQRLRISGVTYGPFPANPDGEPFPNRAQVCRDFARMREAGINAIRTYHVPPEWLLMAAGERGLRVLIDVPWPKHVCFLESPEAMAHARRAVTEAVQRGRRQPCVLGYSVCNEISPSVVRWYGTKRVERFLSELGDIVHQTDPEALATYANFPSTEYLDSSFLDFSTVNVYLHDPETFRRYLFRLQHLIGERPLVLGELGMDTIRHGEEEQASFLAGHSRDAQLIGLAGSFVFSWSDDWHTGGHAINDWAFGITTADRTPKAAYHALQKVNSTSVTGLLDATPRVSVVVCSYNGGRTLEQCVQSLLALDYPNYEVIVVDDGSTDHTASILRRFPTVTSIHTANNGLSAARNAGLQIASGSIVAYTDSDCFADPHWLTHLVYQFQRTDAAAVGGPNLTPDDGWLAACVAAAPGQPTHVLESDQVAEHIPGCNMAFRRDELLAIRGFDPVYRKAGDDVDICWRLQQAGHWITFAPGAFVWHHRRQGPRAFLRQQAGYGEAEALLWFKHPDRFTSRGEGKWRGIIYGSSLRGLQVSEPIIYRGTFAAGLFQTIYQPGPAHWAMLPSTLEWHGLALCLVIAAIVVPWLLLAAAGMVVISVVVALLQAWQAKLAKEHDSIRSRLVVAGLCYLQPLVRSLKRYRTRLFAGETPLAPIDPPLDSGLMKMPLAGQLDVGYWSEDGVGRLPLLNAIIVYLAEHRWGTTLDTGWSEWDFAVCSHLWTTIHVCTVQEDHGWPRHLVRVRYRLRPTAALGILTVVGTTFGALAAFDFGPAFLAIIPAFWLVAISLWWRGTVWAGKVVAAIESQAKGMKMVRCQPATKEKKLSRLVERVKVLLRPKKIESGTVDRIVGRVEALRGPTV